MTGYEIHCICWNLLGRGKMSIDKYLNSNTKNYYEMLAKHFVKCGMSIKEVKDYIVIAYHEDPSSFSPYNLLTDDTKALYNEWKKRESTPSLYLQHVTEGFNFIENYCLRNELSFTEYCDRFLIQHLRKGKVDFAIAVYMKLININTLSKLEKILLKKFIKDYSIVEMRIKDPELHTLLSTRSREMLNLIKRLKTDKTVQPCTYNQ